MSRCNSRRSASSGSSAPQRALMQAWLSSFEGIAQSTAKYIAALAQILRQKAPQRVHSSQTSLMLQPPEPGGSGYAITNGRAKARPYRADYRSDRFASSQSRSSSDKESAESWVALSASSVSIPPNLLVNFSFPFFTT